MYQSKSPLIDHNTDHAFPKYHENFFELQTFGLQLFELQLFELQLFELQLFELHFFELQFFELQLFVFHFFALLFKQIALKMLNYNKTFIKTFGQTSLKLSLIPRFQKFDILETNALYAEIW